MGNSFYKSTVSVFALIGSLTLLNSAQAMEEEGNPLANPHVKRTRIQEQIEASLVPFTPAELSHVTFSIPEQTEQGFGSLPLLTYPIIYSFLSSPEDHKNVRGVSKVWRRENLSYVTSIISNWNPTKEAEPLLFFMRLGGEEFIAVQKRLATVFFDFNPFDKKENDDHYPDLSAVIDTFHYYVDKFPILLHLVSRFYLHSLDDTKLKNLGKVAVESIPTLEANLAQILKYPRSKTKDIEKLEQFLSACRTSGF